MLGSYMPMLILSKIPHTTYVCVLLHSVFPRGPSNIAYLANRQAVSWLMHSLQRSQIAELHARVET